MSRSGGSSRTLRACRLGRRASATQVATSPSGVLRASETLAPSVRGPGAALTLPAAAMPDLLREAAPHKRPPMRKPFVSVSVAKAHPHGAIAPAGVRCYMTDPAGRLSCSGERPRVCGRAVLPRPAISLSDPLRGAEGRGPVRGTGRSRTPRSPRALLVVLAPFLCAPRVPERGCASRSRTHQAWRAGRNGDSRRRRVVSRLRHASEGGHRQSAARRRPGASIQGPSLQVGCADTRPARAGRLPSESIKGSDGK